MKETNGKQLCVLGLGYIGLPSASMFATHGFDVLGVDVSNDIVDTINRGEIHITEPGLATLAAAAVKSQRLRAALEPRPSDVFFIAVPTPVHGDHGADLTYVEQASRAIVPHLRKGNLVILESTSPPGTTVGVVQPILEESGLKGGVDFLLAHSPERVLPGQILRELIDNDRIIGGITPESAEEGKKLYETFVAGDILLTDATTAEMAKVIENTYRDVNIALANELSRICDTLGISAWDVIELANRHPRVNLHKPGPGVGGHCIAVDPWFIVQAVPEQSRLIRLAREINDEQPHYAVQVIESAIAGQESPKIAFLGVAYKANVDDTRESPALNIIQHFDKAGVPFSIFDPCVNRFQYPLAKTKEEALDGATCIALLVNHNEFATWDPAEIKPLMKAHAVVDTRNQLDLAQWRAEGFTTTLLGGKST